MAQTLLECTTIDETVACARRICDDAQGARLVCPEPPSVEQRRRLLVAATHGDANAQHKLGRMYQEGIGGPQDHAEARRLYGLAAAQGQTEARSALDVLDRQAMSTDGVIDLDDGVSPLEEAITQFERISVGVEAAEGSFDGVGSRISGVYEAHERVIALLEAGAPLRVPSGRSLWLLTDMAEALEDYNAQGLSVGAEKEVSAVLACAIRLHGAQGGSLDPAREERRQPLSAATHGDAGTRPQLLAEDVEKYTSMDVPTSLPRLACMNFAEATRLFELAAAKGQVDARLNGQCVSEDLTEARRLFGLAAAQGSAGAQEALDSLDRVAVAQRAKKQVDADAMMEQLLAEDAEEKAKDAAKSAKSAKGKKPKKKGGKPPATSTSVGTDHELEAGDAGVKVAVEDSGEAQAVLMPVAPSPDTEPAANPAAPEPITPFNEAGAAAPVPVPVAIGGASGWGRGGRGLGGR
eukprot:scaffold43349_cov73-Phaeocystis_antarctica.AAC.1